MRQIAWVVAIVLAVLPACGGRTKAAPSPPAPNLAPAPVAPSVDPEAWRNQRPVPPPISDFTPPAATRLVLSGGIPLYVVENRGAPLVVVRAVVLAGSARERRGKHGLAKLIAPVLMSGAAGRTALQLADDLGRMGGTLTLDTDDD